jgi:HAMP domain-containing protein/DNA-directed RNA polymerase subunit RPC12/RpoP
MLVICEDCAKKYDIDETRIQRDKAQFACKECGHIIVVEKPTDAAPETDTKNAELTPSEQESVGDQAAAPISAVAGRTTGKGTPVRVYILVTMIVGFLLVSAAFAYLYMTFIPSIINHQVNLRVEAISQAFSGVVKKPLILKNYLQVNKEAKNISKIKGVAYAAVVNTKGIVIAGFFSDINRFDSQFVQNFKKKGFPREIITQNKISSGQDSQEMKMSIGGQEIEDEVRLIPDTGSFVHVGVYTSEVDHVIRQALMSPLTLSLLAALLFIGLLMAIILSKLIGKPMRELTDVANRISFGQLDLEIPSKGPREMRELAVAFDRMRISIKAALDRLRK